MSDEARERREARLQELVDRPDDEPFDDEGDAVEFTLAKGDKGLQAEEVTKP